MTTKQQIEVNVLATIIFQEHKTLTLPTEVTASITRRSKISLDRDRAKGRGIPCSKLGMGSGSDRALYNIYDISKYIVSRKMKVVS